MRKRAVAICLIIGMLITLFPVYAQAAEEDSQLRALYGSQLRGDFPEVWEVTAGKDFPQRRQIAGSASDGDNDFQWSLENGLLLISGDGPMPEWESCKDIPWYERVSEITEVRIAGGITTVEQNAFFWCTNLTTVTLGSSIERIGAGTFLKCEKLETIHIPASVTSIDVMAFAESGLTEVIFEGKAPEISLNAWKNVKAAICYYSDKGGWEDIIGENYGGFLTWVDLYQQENGLIEGSAVKMKYGKREDSVFTDKSLPGVPSADVSQYARELFLWAKAYGYENVLTENICGEIVKRYMPTVVYAEDGAALIEDRYKTWEIMRDVMMISSAKESINQWERKYLQDAAAIDLTDAQEQLSRILSVYTSYVEETERNPVANALYNIYALPILRDEQVWKVARKQAAGDMEDALNKGDFEVIAEAAMSAKAAWKADGIDSIIASGGAATEDVWESLKEDFVKDLAKEQMKKFISDVAALNPTLAELRDLSDAISSHEKSFKTYSAAVEFAPSVLFEIELLKMGKQVLETIDQIKEAQFFMIQYDTLRNHRERYDLMIRENGEPIDLAGLTLLEANGGIELNDFQKELWNIWYAKDGNHPVEDARRVTLTSLASMAVTLQNMTPAAMREKIVAYWAAEVTQGSGGAYQVQYTLDAQARFQVMDDSDYVLGAYVPGAGYAPEADPALFPMEAVYVSQDAARKEYVTVAVRNAGYRVQVMDQALFVLVDVLTQANTSYTALYENAQAQTTFALQGGEILVWTSNGETSAPTAIYSEEQSIVSLDADSLRIQYQSSDSANRVTESLELPQAGDLGSGVIWSSGNDAVASGDGTIVRGDDDRRVTLTAVVTSGDARIEKEFPIVVAGKNITISLVSLESGGTIGRIAAKAGDSLTLETISGAVPEGTSVTGCFHDLRQEYPYYENQEIDQSIVLYVKTEGEGAEEWDLSISEQPRGASYKTGEPAQPLTVRYTSSAEVTLQWYAASLPDLRDGRMIENAVEASYTPATAEAGTTYYYVALTTAGGKRVTSDSAAVAVTDTRESFLTAWLDTEGLHYKAALPDGTAAKLLAVGYAPSGRVIDVVMENARGAGLVSIHAAARYRVFLVHPETFAPLCPYWDSGQAAAAN